MHFLKKIKCRSWAGPKSLAYVNHCSAKFQPILNCFIPILKQKYEDLENIKTHRINIVVFNLHLIKHWAFFGMYVDVTEEGLVNPKRLAGF